MKRYFGIFIFLSIISLISSCGGSQDKEANKHTKLTSLDELKRKYHELEFIDCEQFLSIGDEMIEVYVSTIDKAFDGNLSAKDDLENFDSFMSRFDKFHETLADECPERFEKWTAKTDSIMSRYEDKLIIIFRDESDVSRWEELDDDIEIQVAELNEELLRLEQEDSLYNNE